MTSIEAVTIEGRVATGVLLILGVALFTAITASLVSFLVSPSRTAGTVPEDPSRHQDPLDALGRLASLADRGVITRDEYAAKRMELLARI
jgi:hypothetical protein